MSATPTTSSQTDNLGIVSFETAVQQEFEHLSRVHPTAKDIPSCWSLFSQYMECNGRLYCVHDLQFPNKYIVVKNQMKSLYRYGHMAECSQKSKDWRFCLTLKTLDAEERRKEWLMHRARWWAERRTSGSSEDVWDMRRCANLYFLYLHF